MKKLVKHIKSDKSSLMSLNEKLVINKNYKHPIFEISNYFDSDFFIEIHIQDKFLSFRIISKNETSESKSGNYGKTYKIKGSIVAGKEIKRPSDINYNRYFYFDKQTGLFHWKYPTYDIYRILFPVSYINETIFDGLRKNKEIDFKDIDKMFDINSFDLITRIYGDDKKDLLFKIISTEQDINDIKNTLNHTQDFI